jgi:hypothetical protein
MCENGNEIRLGEDFAKILEKKKNEYFERL